MEKEISKISPEQAQREISTWLDKKKIMESQRAEYKSSIAILADAVSQGVLVVDEESNELIHNLLFPIGDDKIIITTITYKPRLNDLMLRPYIKNVDAGDADGRLIAYLAALTSQSKKLLEHLDTVDKRIANAIVVFFT